MNALRKLLLEKDPLGKALSLWLTPEELRQFAEDVFEEGYQHGHSAGYEEALEAA